MREGISPARLRTLQQQLGALRLLIIDEVSMVGGEDAQPDRQALA